MPPQQASNKLWTEQKSRDSNTDSQRRRPDRPRQCSCRIDLASGARTPVRQIAPPPESLGSGGIGLLRITPDGRGYAFGYHVTMADLYIVKGLK